MDKNFIEEMERRAEEVTEKKIRATLNKLQHELKTDATQLGIEVHRKYPQEWQRLKENWNQYFSDADIMIEVTHDIRDPGLLFNNIDREREKPEGHLYPTF